MVSKTLYQVYALDQGSGPRILIVRPEGCITFHKRNVKIWQARYLTWGVLLLTAT